MKGIILAGGTGTRLHPITRGVSKQLLPIYSKPMIYYPLSVLMFAGITEILIITTPEDQQAFKNVLGDGSWLGIKLEYAVQKKPEGLAQAFIIGESFIGEDSVAMILGDNLYFGHGLSSVCRRATKLNQGATIFAYHVNDPERYGVMEFDEHDNPKAIVEKPEIAPSNYAVTGLYFYDNSVIEKAKNLKPSSRGELEITDINNIYLEERNLRVEKLGRGTAWLDTGTFESLLQAGEFVQVIEERSGLMVACLEEIAFHLGYINATQLEILGKKMSNNAYGKYLMKIAQDPSSSYYMNVNNGF